MSNRIAVDTIKGYFYQFDHFTMQILKQENENDKVTIEGIEDIDIATASEMTAIQCKYYSKKEYNHSTIKEPIMLMLNNFSNNISKKYQYNIYGYFKSGQEKLPTQVSLSFLKKNFLTYKSKGITYEKHKELGLTDNNLEQFLNQLRIDVYALSYEDQNSVILQEIMKNLSCSALDAEYFYNNALKVVKELSVQQEVEKRSISKKEFLNKINNRELLFNSWYLKLKSKNYFFQLVRKKYFSSLNISPYSRFILIDCSKDMDEVHIKEVLLHVANKLSKVTKREIKPFCPYVYLHGVEEAKLIKVKQLLREDNLVFVDGHSFKGADFNLTSILINANYHNQLKLKIINEIKLIDLVLNQLANTRQIFQFYISKPFYDNNNHEHNKIPITEIKDIKKII